MSFNVFVLAVLSAIFGCAGSFAGESDGFPFEFKSGLIWVKAAVSGQTLNFVLDSGAGSSVLSLQAARRLGVRLGASTEVQTVGSHSAAYQVHDFKFEVGNIPIRGDLLAINLGSASAACGRSIDGLLGGDFFKGRIVRINFKTHWVELLAKPEAAHATAVLPLRYHNDALCVPVGVNGLKPEWTRLDTGCNSSLEWTQKVGNSNHGTKPSLGLSPTSGKTILANVQLGSARIAGVKMGLHSHEFFAGEAGLLGSGLLSKFCVTIDAKNMRLLLERF